MMEMETMNAMNVNQCSSMLCMFPVVFPESDGGKALVNMRTDCK